MQAIYICYFFLVISSHPGRNIGGMCRVVVLLIETKRCNSITIIISSQTVYLHHTFLLHACMYILALDLTPTLFLFFSTPNPVIPEVMKWAFIKLQLGSYLSSLNREETMPSGELRGWKDEKMSDKKDRWW